MSTPEWSIFDRLDELEDITLKLMEKADTTEPTLKEVSPIARDASILAKQGFIFSFINYAVKASNPRETKDMWIRILKTNGLSEKTLDSMEKLMFGVCESIEKH